MIKIGLTGGIGSGKSTVASIFKHLGVAIYFSDTRAKFLMASDPKVIAQIEDSFGSESYVNGQLNKTYISKKVFSDSRALKTLNSIVHPAVKNDFNLWCTTQKGPYIIKEAAILFESKSNIGLDKVILVSSPKELKLSRVLKRDQTDEKSVLERMDAQWKDSEKRLLADYEIRNDEKKSLIEQVNFLHKCFCAL
ncbi:MAG: dephospho-CoA kinase [Flavobacteriales bacterium]|nr:dephospho-CoA kinase [Flavobacteriales bacterium]MDG1395239.1 dephospho-CoA kinase [Flavobacteriales bacterium]